MLRRSSPPLRGDPPQRRYAANAKAVSDARSPRPLATATRLAQLRHVGAAVPIRLGCHACLQACQRARRPPLAYNSKAHPVEVHGAGFVHRISACLQADMAPGGRYAMEGPLSLTHSSSFTLSHPG